MDKASQILLANLDRMLDNLSVSMAQRESAQKPQASAIDGSVAVRNDDDRVVLTVVDPEGRSATVLLTVSQAWALTADLSDTAQGIQLSGSEGY